MNKNEGCNCVCVCVRTSVLTPGENLICVCVCVRGGREGDGVEAIYDNGKDAYHDYNHSRHCFWLYEMLFFFYAHGRTWLF